MTQFTKFQDLLIRQVKKLLKDELTTKQDAYERVANIYHVKVSHVESIFVLYKKSVEERTK